MFRKKLYRGISFTEFKHRKTLSLSDVDLVKRDLLNHIYTRKGERIKMPTFGTNIPYMVMEPLDDTTVYIIGDELRRVIDYDPRVELVGEGIHRSDISVVTDYDANSITVM